MLETWNWTRVQKQQRCWKKMKREWNAKSRAFFREVLRRNVNPFEISFPSLKSIFGTQSKSAETFREAFMSLWQELSQRSTAKMFSTTKVAKRDKTFNSITRDLSQGKFLFANAILWWLPISSLKYFLPRRDLIRKLQVFRVSASVIKLMLVSTFFRLLTNTTRPSMPCDSLRAANHLKSNNLRRRATNKTFRRRIPPASRRTGVVNMRRLGKIDSIACHPQKYALMSKRWCFLLSDSVNVFDSDQKQNFKLLFQIRMFDLCFHKRFDWLNNWQRHKILLIPELATSPKTKIPGDVFEKISKETFKSLYFVFAE